MPCTALPRLWYEPTAARCSAATQSPTWLTHSTEGVQGGQEGDCLNLFSCLLAAHATRLERDTSSDMTFTKREF
jgi:hypothetical protein